MGRRKHKYHKNAVYARYDESERRREQRILHATVLCRFDPAMRSLIERVARFQGLKMSDYCRLAVYEKLYRQMKEGFLEHRLLSQPLTPEETQRIINIFEGGKLRN